MRSRWVLVAQSVAGLLLATVVMEFWGGMPVAAAAETTTTRKDPLPGFAIKLEVQNVFTAFFQEISGIGSESEVIEQKVATATGQPIVQNLPGRLKWKELVVKRALTNDKSFSTWRAQVETGNLKDAIFNFSITLLNTALQPVARWEGVGGWPSKLNLIFPFIAPGGTPTPVVEELTIVHSGLVRTQ